MENKTALITGITGQDGFFLSQLLVDKGYSVHGLVRHSIMNQMGNMAKLDAKYIDAIDLHHGDVTDSGLIDNLFNKYKFDECYHLAAQSFVGYSFENPRATYDININGTLNILEAIKHFSPKTRMYFAGTSELYGKVKEIPQTEETPFHPRSPYGISKLAGFWSVKHYREAYDIFACSGILFNHESEVRGDEFVTQKIIKHIAGREKGKHDNTLKLGNLNAKRDWGYARDYVEGMHLMLQQDKPEDYVLATGKTYSVREFVENAYKALGKQVKWVKRVNDLDEKGYVDGKLAIEISENFYRPCEVDLLVGNPNKAEKELGWVNKTSLEELVDIMIKSALKNG